MAQPEPLIITIISVCVPIQARGRFHTYRNEVEARYKVPSLLRVCNESRELPQGQYELSFELNLGGRNPVYFNYESEALGFDGLPSFQQFSIDPCTPSRSNQSLNIPLHPNMKILAVSFRKFPLNRDLRSWILTLGSLQHVCLISWQGGLSFLDDCLARHVTRL